MNFDFSPEQEQLRSDARAFLARNCPPARVRELMESPNADDADLWRKMAELGWTSLAIPEANGGFGTFLDLAVVLEEMGRAMLPGPYFDTMALYVPTLVEAGGQRTPELLSAVAEGRSRGSVALTEAGGRWDADGVAMSASAVGGGFELSGQKVFVASAGSADNIIVVTRTRGSGEDGVSLFVVGRDAPGVTIREMDTLDRTRRWSEVTFSQVKVSTADLLGELHRGWPALRRALDTATAGLCIEMVGGAQHVLDISTEYAKSRHQFGRPIGSFQGVSHKLADMLLEVESSRSASYYAAWAVDADAPDRQEAVSIAKAYTSDAFRHAAGTGIQVHGGIGFTWEHEMHLYFKRAKASEVTLGDANFHRELVAQALDL